MQEVVVHDQEPIDKRELIEVAAQPEEGLAEHLNRYGSDISKCPVAPMLGETVLTQIQERVTAIQAEAEQFSGMSVADILAKKTQAEEKAPLIPAIDEPSPQASVTEVSSPTELYMHEHVIRETETAVQVPVLAVASDSPVLQEAALARRPIKERTAVPGSAPELAHTMDESKADIIQPESVAQPLSEQPVPPAEDREAFSSTEVTHEALPRAEIQLEAAEPKVEPTEEEITLPDALMSPADIKDTIVVEPVKPEVSAVPSIEPNDSVSGEAVLPSSDSSMVDEVVEEILESFIVQNESQVDEGAVEVDLVRDDLSHELATFIQELRTSGDEISAERVSELEQRIIVILRQVLPPGQEVKTAQIRTYIQEMIRHLSVDNEKVNLAWLNLSGTTEHKFYAGWRTTGSLLVHPRSHKILGRYVLSGLLFRQLNIHRYAAV